MSFILDPDHHYLIVNKRAAEAAQLHEKACIARVLESSRRPGSHSPAPDYRYAHDACPQPAAWIDDGKGIRWLVTFSTRPSKCGQKSCAFVIDVRHIMPHPAPRGIVDKC